MPRELHTLGGILVLLERIDRPLSRNNPAFVGSLREALSMTLYASYYTGPTASRRKIYLRRKGLITLYIIFLRKFGFVKRNWSVACFINTKSVSFAPESQEKKKPKLIYISLHLVMLPQCAQSAISREKDTNLRQFKLSRMTIQYGDIQ